MRTTKTLPTIDIRYGKFLVPFFDCYAQNNNSITNRPDNKTILANIKQQRLSWKEVHETILIEMQEVTGLTFLENTIPVYIVPTYEGAFSDPIVISSLQTEHFVDVLTHELIHRLGDYNKEKVSIRGIGKELYKHIDDHIFQDHIFVHAIHTYLYLDILKTPQSLADDIASSDGAYANAWQLVQDTGYKEIIERFKKCY